MQTALILMTILGCDDSVSQCHYIATAAPRYTSVALCDAASQKELTRLGNVNYPTVVAVCQKPAVSEQQIVASAEEIHPLPQADLPPQLPVTDARPGLAARAVAMVSNSLPTLDGVKSVMRKPGHFVGKSYSWLAQKIGD